MNVLKGASLSVKPAAVERLCLGAPTQKPEDVDGFSFSRSSYAYYPPPPPKLLESKRALAAEMTVIEGAA